MIHTLVSTLVIAMLRWVPVQHPGDVDRYREIAEDIADEAADTKEAFVLASIASLESFYRRDVDECRASGDHGRAWTIFQIQTWGSKRREICQDRKAAIREALRHVRWSLARCKDLSGYTKGFCKKDEPKAAHRMRRAELAFAAAL